MRGLIGRVRRLLRAPWKQLQGFVVEVWRRMVADRLPLTAAAIAFFLLVSIVPLLSLVVSIAAFFFSQQDILDLLAQNSEFIRTLNDTLGTDISRALQREILTVVSNRGFLTGLALLIGFWTGTQIFVILESAMNQVWHTTQSRPFWQSRLLALQMLLITGGALLVATALIYGIRLLATLNIPLLDLNVRTIPILINILITWVVPLIITTILFESIYRILPTKRITWHSALPGAVFAALAWTIFLHLFGIYASRVARYSIVYGSLAGLILLMFWFYYSSLIMLVGAEIAAVYHQRLMEAGNEEEQLAEVAEKKV